MLLFCIKVCAKYCRGVAKGCKYTIVLVYINSASGCVVFMGPLAFTQL